MERNYYKGDFERFLKDNADQYRMYPSEKVWNGIYKSLHSRTRWYRYSALALLLISIVSVTIILSTRSGSTKLTSAAKQNVQKAINNGQADAITSIIPATGILSDNKVPAEAKKQTLALGQSSFSKAPSVNSDNSYLTPGISTTQQALFGKNSQVSIFDIVAAETPVNNDPVTEVYRPDLSEQISFFAYGNSGSAEKYNTEVFTQDFTPRTNTAPEIPVSEIRKLASLNIGKRKKGTEWQFHFTPTISYRKLSENKTYLNSLTPASALGYTAYLDVNQVVDHKPDMGLEIGVDMKKTLGNRVKTRTGLQFNLTRYDIRAYSYNAEPATIALNSSFGGLDILSRTSNYRNFGGNKSDWLENVYAQIALPVGLEYRITNSKKAQWGIASSLQPTYLLGKKAYLISSDYKNYVSVPHLVRRWNVNADIETFISYSTGKVQWQVGPQVRYQLLSTFINKYPVKENLFDFGLKVGMTFNK